MSGSNRIAFNILQNQFTTYFMTAIRWQKIAYLKKRIKLGKLELSTDFDRAFAQMKEVQKKVLFPWNGMFDEELYQELCVTLLDCIRKSRI